MFVSPLSAVTAATMKITYDIDIDEEEDKWISVVDEAFVGLRLVTVSAQFLLEHFPIVRHIPAWFPGAGFQRTLARARAPSDYMLDVPFTIAKKASIHFLLSLIVFICWGVLIL